MEHGTIENISEVISYIEIHLNENPDLASAADAVHYSKYHLHRMFTDAVGMTFHDYVRRRRLTEAAKLLVFSQKPLIEIALFAGYESQQAFSGIFKSMYKQTPAKYRANKKFYPLQLRCILHELPSLPDAVQPDIICAAPEDIPDWMDFASSVIDGFPCFDPEEHLRRLRYYIDRKQALLMRDSHTVVGALAFSGTDKSIDFLGVHPQHRRRGIEKAFLDFVTNNIFTDGPISITTFRAGDRADTGQRAAYTRLGFTEAELLTEFGYPTQKLVLPPKRKDVSDE